MLRRHSTPNAQRHTTRAAADGGSAALANVLGQPYTPEAGAYFSLTGRSGSGRQQPLASNTVTRLSHFSLLLCCWIRIPFSVAPCSQKHCSVAQQSCHANFMPYNATGTDLLKCKQKLYLQMKVPPRSLRLAAYACQQTVEFELTFASLQKVPNFWQYF